MPAPVDLLADFIDQPPRTAADEWLRAGLALWAKRGATMALHQCLRLPPSPAALRRVQRDRLLRQAASLIDAPTDWQRAGKLLERVRLFELRTWAVWHRLESAPPHATDLQRILFDLMRLGVDTPGTQRQFHTILLGE